MNKFLRTKFEAEFPKGLTKKKISKKTFEEIIEGIYNYTSLATLDEIAFILKDKSIKTFDEFKGELHLMAAEKLKKTGTIKGQEMSNLEFIMEQFKTPSRD
jgi:hypothetical protein